MYTLRTRDDAGDAGRRENRLGPKRKCPDWANSLFTQSGHKKTRQRPTFPQSHPCSIIGAVELNFRVRDGNGCGLYAMVTGKRFRQSQVSRFRSQAKNLKPETWNLERSFNF